MDIYIFRHGEAEPKAAGVADAARKLIRSGRRDVKRVAQAARAAKVKPELILTSPLIRAKETAEIAAKVFRGAAVAETANLLPDANPERLWKELGALKGVSRVMVAGHEPHLSRFAAYTLEAAVSMDLKKGAMLCLTTPGRLGRPRGVLQWLLTPKLAG
jgi:phosphohistidine phosphatase